MIETITCRKDVHAKISGKAATLRRQIYMLNRIVIQNYEYLTDTGLDSTSTKYLRIELVMD